MTLYMGPEEGVPGVRPGTGPTGLRPGLQMGAVHPEILMRALQPLMERTRQQLGDAAGAQRALEEIALAAYLIGRGMDARSALAMAGQWRGPAAPPRDRPPVPPGGRPGLPRAQLIRDIQHFMLDQITAATFYRQLADRAADPMVRKYIQHAMEDEEKHYRMLGALYRELTGRTYEVQPEQVTFRNLADGLRQAMDDEYKAMEEYRAVYLRVTEPRIRDLFFELMTDELEHATRFNYALQVVTARGTEEPMA